jgi:hypothetical protein
MGVDYGQGQDQASLVILGKLYAMVCIGDIVIDCESAMGNQFHFLALVMDQENLSIVELC